MDVHFVKIKGFIRLRMLNETLIILVKSSFAFYTRGPFGSSTLTR